jgi:hypothetical protein
MEFCDVYSLSGTSSRVTVSWTCRNGRRNVHNFLGETFLIKLRRWKNSVKAKLRKVTCDNGLSFSVAGFGISDIEALEASNRELVG